MLLEKEDMLQMNQIKKDPPQLDKLKFFLQFLFGTTELATKDRLREIDRIGKKGISNENEKVDQRATAFKVKL